MQIFSLKSVLNDVDSPVDQKNTNATHENLRGSTQRLERVHTTKLILVAQYECSGTITSIARVKILQSKSGGEALLFSLQDAKLSLVEWDPETYSISTISIHYYERDDLLGGPWMPDLGRCVNYLSVDPSSRCAALKFGARHLAILPFRQTGDELVMDEYDPNIDGERHDSLGKIKEAADSTEKTPYAASFVLSLLALDPNLSHPLHLAFLYEYREPTFGIISSQVAISTALLHERRDTVSYSVFTLDLEQRASTTLLTITNLPYDLFAVVPLRLPVGGALLIGGNELIHVDQAGKTTGVAVNEFAKQSSAFAMADQSDLALRLEYCVVEQLGLDNRELLLVLNTGEFVIITFKIDGRSVSGLSIRRVTQQNGGTIVKAGSSCTSMVGRGRMFVGSERADSVILGWSRRSDKPKRHRSRLTWAEDETLGINEEDIEDEDDDVDDDDLYSGTKADDRGPEHSLSALVADSGDDYVFRIHDSLQNSGPMTDIALRNLAPFEVAEPTKGTSSGLELTVSSGRGSAGGLTTLTKNVDLRIVEQYDILGVSGVWAICANQTPEETSVQYSEGGDKTKAKYDRYVIVSKSTWGEQLSNAYKFTATGPKEVKDTDFDPEAGATVEVGCVNSGNRIVQVLPGELRTFDGGEFQMCIPFSFCIVSWTKAWHIVGWMGCFHGLVMNGFNNYLKKYGSLSRNMVMKVLVHISAIMQMCTLFVCFLRSIASINTKIYLSPRIHLDHALVVLRAE